MGVRRSSRRFQETFGCIAASVLRRFVSDSTAFPLLQPSSFWETGRLWSRTGKGLACPNYSRCAYAGVGGLLSCRRPWRRSLR